MGDPARAEALYREVWEIHRRTRGDDDPSTLGARNNLASVLGDLGRPQEELEHFEAVLERRRATQGADHPDALGAALNLASAYETVGRIDEAATLDLHRGRFDAAIERSVRQVEKRTESLGARHDLTLVSRRNLAAAYERAGDLPSAAKEMAAAAAGLQTALGPDHPLTLNTRSALALIWAKLGRNGEARPAAGVVSRSGRRGRSRSRRRCSGCSYRDRRRP